jgi:hypothetical protein
MDYTDDEARRRYIDTTLARLVSGPRTSETRQENQNG